MSTRCARPSSERWVDREGAVDVIRAVGREGGRGLSTSSERWVGREGAVDVIRAVGRQGGGCRRHQSGG